MKIMLEVFFFCGLFSQGISQPFADTAGSFTIINSQEVISNTMIFYEPLSFKKNTRPLFLVDGKEVATIAFYNREEFKKITVWQPREALAKFGRRGKRGAVIVELKDNVKALYIKILSNKIYYQCTIGGKIIDTSKTYYENNTGKNCFPLDLRDTSTTQTLYIDFSNEVVIKNLGVGWDKASVYFAGAMASGSSGHYMVRVKKEGIVKIGINTCDINNKCKLTEIFLKALPLPASGKP